MHGKLDRQKIRRRWSIAETLFLAVIGTSVFLMAGWADSKGLPLKWVTALVGTIVPFAVMVFTLREGAVRWSFWAAVCVCLFVHLLVIWIVFQYVLASIRSLSPLFWLPVMLLEMFVLLITVSRVENMLTGNPTGRSQR
jgi:hypothetical protein